MRYKPLEGDTPEIRAFEQAYRAGVIERRAVLAAVGAQRGPLRWLAWARFWLLVYGVVLALAGVVFFFAYNWAAMHRFEKFALIQSGIVIAILLAWRHGWRGSLGQAFLCAGAVFVGVFLAVFGQVYQTGADAWQLFFGWAALIFIWVLASNSAPLWVLWIVVADLAVVLNAMQVQRFTEFPDLVLLAGAIPLAVLAVRETLDGLGRQWLSDAWLRPLLLLAVLGFFTFPALAGIVVDRHGDADAAWIAGWLALVVAAFGVYRWRMRDILALTLVVFDAAIVLLVAIADALFDMREETALFLFSLVMIGVVAAAYYWLRSLASAIHHETNAMEVNNASA